MTPEEFNADVLPKILAAWDNQCFCASPGFRKLVGFNFRDYGIGPVNLVDAEILIHSVVHQNFIRQGESSTHQGASTQNYTCPQCHAECTTLYEDFSISMYHTVLTFPNDAATDRTGFYLVGFRGFDIEEMKTINDYTQAETVEQFISQLFDA